MQPCVICGYPLTDQHHILPKDFGGRDSSDNLVALCPNHHRAIHLMLSFQVWHDRDQLYERRIRGFGKRRERLLEAVIQDQRLRDFYFARVLPAWRAAGSPAYANRLRRAYARWQRWEMENA